MSPCALLRLPRLAPRRWRAARAARRRVIYSAGCARVTEPGPADEAADALGRGAARRPGDKGPLCVQLPPLPPGAGGRGGGRAAAPEPPPSARHPSERDRSLLPLAGSRAPPSAAASSSLFLKYLISKFPSPQSPLPLPPFLSARPPTQERGI